MRGVDRTSESYKGSTRGAYVQGPRVFEFREKSVTHTIYTLLSIYTPFGSDCKISSAKLFLIRYSEHVCTGIAQNSADYGIGGYANR